jgi:hypothetical protein
VNTRKDSRGVPSPATARHRRGADRGSTSGLAHSDIIPVADVPCPA